MTARKEGSARLVRGELERMGLHKHHPFYLAWCNMKTRCDNPNSTQYKWYGAKGISYASAWKVFLNFRADMFVLWRPGLTLDRIDNAADYCADNCRWVTPQVNSQNRSSNVLDAEPVESIRYLFSTGEYTQSELAIRFNVAQPVISSVVRYKTWA